MGISGIGASGTLALWEPKPLVSNAAVAPVASIAATSQVSLNKLKSAFITTVVKQMDEYEKLIGLKVVQKKATPTDHSTVQDISAQWR